MKYFITLLFFGLIINSIKAQELKLMIPVGHKNDIKRFLYSPSRKYIATIAKKENVIKIWQVSTGRLLCNLEAHTNEINDFSFSNNDQFLLSSSMDSSFCIWDLNKGDMAKKINIAHCNILQTVFSPDNKFIYSISCNNYLWCFDSKGNLIRKAKFDHELDSTRLLSPDITCEISFDKENKFCLVTVGRADVYNFQQLCN